MNKTQLEILSFLDDKKYVSGEDIANKLNISRAAVSKNIKKLKSDYQIEISANPKIGYLLAEKLDLINIDELEKTFKNIKYFHSIDSTLRYAIEHQSNYSGSTIFISEYQTSGFGRFNRSWDSPFGKNIYCTLLEEVELDISKLNGLSLVVAISVTKVLNRLDLNAKLKWPNDIYIDNKKISGVMINISAEMNGKAKLFISFGLNVNMQSNQTIERDWASIKLESKRHANRTKLLIELINSIETDLDVFLKEGFLYFKDEYEKLNYLKDKRFTLMLADKQFNDCKYLRLSEIGEIVAENSQGVHSFSSGDISVLESSIKSR